MRNYKRVFVLTAYALSIAIAALSACANNIQSTDLSHITFDGALIGDDFEQIETGKYTLSTRYPEDEYTYNYEEWRISVYDSKIRKITASFETINISVNGREDCQSIDDIINILGEDYHSSWYDKEQRLMQIQYWDKDNGTQCIFVYDKDSRHLVWGIMQTAS